MGTPAPLVPSVRPSSPASRALHPSQHLPGTLPSLLAWGLHPPCGSVSRQASASPCTSLPFWPLPPLQTPRPPLPVWIAHLCWAPPPSQPPHPLWPHPSTPILPWHPAFASQCQEHRLPMPLDPYPLCPLKICPQPFLAVAPAASPIPRTISGPSPGFFLTPRGIFSLYPFQTTSEFPPCPLVMYSPPQIS